MTSFSCTLRAKIENQNFDYVEFYKAINNQLPELRGIQTSGGGRFVELCFENPEAAELAELTGIDFKEQHYDLRPLGQRLIFVSTFVPIQVEDSELLTLLKRYGQVKNIRRLYHKDPELKHLENGCRVVAFSKLNTPLPKRISYGGLSIGFKYTGQPTSCIRCSSFDHEIANCPRRRFKPTTTTETEQIKPASEPAQSPPMAQTLPELSDSESDSESAVETAMEVQVASNKRKASSPAQTPEKKNQKKKNPLENYDKFVKDLHKDKDSSILIRAPKEMVAKARSLHMQSEFGDMKNADVSSLSFDNKKRVLKLWGELQHKIKPDAKAELMNLYMESFHVHYN